MVPASRFWGPALAAFALSCSAVLGIDGLVADRVGDGGVPADGAAPEASVPDATSDAPPRIKGSGFSIDPYEVTTGDYKAWLATSPSLAGQRDECVFNDSYQPGAVSPRALVALIDAGFSPDPECTSWLDKHTDDKFPITCIDWCDAVAYCNWAGGHLCAAIGGASQSYKNDQQPARGEWWSACSSNGAHPYPYGDTYTQGTCNDSNTKIYDVGKFPACQVNGVFDLSGNVTEWEDSCSAYDNPPEAENCLRRGGAFFDTAQGLTCTAFREAIRGSGDSNNGFRCCGPP
jgi:formylglycine-generating enzyme required for sulfatase activity